MDFVSLAESGTYSRSDLTEVQKEFIGGMEYVKDKLLDNFGTLSEDSDDTGEISETLGKIVGEIRKSVIEELKEYLYMDICEMTVMFADHNAYDTESEKAEE